MLYFPDTHYFKNKRFSASYAIGVVAEGIGNWCDYYRAELVMPKKGIETTIRKGKFPPGAQKRREFITELINWLFENSQADVFHLNLDDGPIDITSGKISMFSIHDSVQNWTLSLNAGQFASLQVMLKFSKLPKTLFYPEHECRRFLKPQSVFDRVLSLVGFTGGSYIMFTPQEWKREPNKEKYLTWQEE